MNNYKHLANSIVVQELKQGFFIWPDIFAADANHISVHLLQPRVLAVQ